MRERKTLFRFQHALFITFCALLSLWLPLSASAQGSGPARGMEVILWLFIAVAAVFVLVLSSVFFRLGKKAFFKDREASELQKLVLFAASILASCAVGIAVMIVLDLR